MTIHDDADIRTAVRERYAAAATSASCCGPASCGPAFIDAIDPFGQSQYGDDERALLPEEALVASLGCGNPTMLAELNPGDVVLDLGSGGGIDVLLSARRVAPGGKAYGLDMTPEMLELANANRVKSGIENVEFLLGSIEDVPLPDASVDVIISNCVVNLSPDKDRVFRESFRVLAPGGRFAISDMVLSRPLPSDVASVMALWTGCIAGALTEDQVLAGLEGAGFSDVTLEPTTVFGREELEGLAAALDPSDIPAGLDIAAAIDTLDGVIRAAFIRATKPGTPAQKETRMPVVRVYEPALCCNTGVCGEDVDQALVTFTADLTSLADQGADVGRHNLANDPMAFANDKTVRAFLEVAGSEGLPLTTVDGVTVMTGTYPSRDQLARFAGVDAGSAVPAGATLLQVDGDASDSACGCGPSGCC
ncbi:MAG: arsenite methyltransferase [Actinomycetota bacterium]|jgi:SAM-dependent methyltransferase|nr:arsenite methyltransferase [Actinomycetota bacterium]